ncbi:MAG: hypothetical protein U1E65_18130 [Myxococcota bacterium]
MKTSLTQQRVNNLLHDPKINKSGDDVTWFSGWSHKVTTYQVRLDKAETQDLVNAIAGFSKANQKRIVKELHARMTPPPGPFGSPAVALESAGAANLMTKLADSLDLDLKFKASSKRPATPMG